jgi:hypothetical protein
MKKAFEKCQKLDTYESVWACLWGKAWTAEDEKIIKADVCRSGVSVREFCEQSETDSIETPLPNWIVREHQFERARAWLEERPLTHEQKKEWVVAAILHHDQVVLDWVFERCGKRDVFWDPEIQQEVWVKAISLSSQSNEKKTEETIQKCLSFFGNRQGLRVEVWEAVFASLVGRKEWGAAKVLLEEKSLEFKVGWVMDQVWRAKSAQLMKMSIEILNKKRPHKWDVWWRNHGKKTVPMALKEAWFEQLLIAANSAWKSRVDMEGAHAYLNCLWAFAIENEKDLVLLDRGMAMGYFLNYEVPNEEKVASKRAHMKNDGRFKWYRRFWEKKLMPRLNLDLSPEGWLREWAQVGVKWENQEWENSWVTNRLSGRSDVVLFKDMMANLHRRWEPYALKKHVGVPMREKAAPIKRRAL